MRTASYEDSVSVGNTDQYKRHHNSDVLRSTPDPNVTRRMSSRKGLGGTGRLNQHVSVEPDFSQCTAGYATGNLKQDKEIRWVLQARLGLNV